MRIPDKFLDCVLYLYHSVPNADAGSSGGGSGFLVGVPSTRLVGSSFIFAVTNQHVLDSGADVIRLNTVSGQRKIVETDPRKWIPHPKGDDVAVYPMPLVDGVDKFSWVSMDTFIGPSVIDAEKLGPGDNVFVIGRFINHEGKQPPWDMQVGSNTGMMGVVPAWKLADIFNTQGMQDKFAAAEDNALKERGPPPATLDSDAVASDVAAVAKQQ